MADSKAGMSPKPTVGVYNTGEASRQTTNATTGSPQTNAGVYETEADEGPRRSRVVRVVRRPRRSTWLYWLSAGIADIADSVERTNHYLEQNRPAKATEAFVDVFSLRRFAPILPGGGVLRGAKHPPEPVIPSATSEGGRAVAPAVRATNQPPR